jgi:hypothetical protein
MRYRFASATWLVVAESLYVARVEPLSCRATGHCALSLGRMRPRPAWTRLAPVSPNSPSAKHWDVILEIPPSLLHENGVF